MPGLETSSGIDPERLGGWLDEQGLPGAGEELTVAPLTGGASNEVYHLIRGDHDMVLRRPPVHAAQERAATILREARVLAALVDSDVPHSRLLAVTEDPEVIGTAFYVMELVEGWSPMSTGSRGPAPFDTDLGARAELGREIVRGLARLAAVDWRALGLEGLGRPAGFHERQVPRWMHLYERVAFRDVPGLDDAARWLEVRAPRAWEPGIMHGDYSFANVMFAHGVPARLAAIVDWEMATVGDPLLDLGWLLMRWPDPEHERPRGAFDMDGMPGRSEVIELYTTVSGREVVDLDYYEVLAYFKNAVVLEAGYARYVQGVADNPKMAAFGDMVIDMARLAAEISRDSTLAASPG